MYRKSNKGWLKHIDFMLIDMLNLEVSYFLDYMICHDILSNLMVRQSYHLMDLCTTISEIHTSYDP